MDESTAVALAREHVAVYGLTLSSIMVAVKERRGVLRKSIWYIRAESSVGDVQIWIDSKTGAVDFAVQPNYRDAHGRLLPLWVVYPSYTSVTCGWRQGSGELYKLRWHSWWRTLTAEAKAAYRTTYREPRRDDLCWKGFYDDIAETPTTGTIGDFIIGRV